MSVLDHQQCHITDSPVEIEATGLCPPLVPYTTGLPAQERPELPGYNSGILSVVVCTMLIVVFSLHHYPRYFKSLTQNIWKVRIRTNVFDDGGINDRSTVCAMSLQVVVYEALLIMSAVISGLKNFHPWLPLMLTGIFIAMTGCYYVWQIVMYKFLGYVFASKPRTQLWIQGFYSSQGLLGFLLLMPTLIGLFYPTSVKTVLLISILLYAIARIMFICKGFRIFYHNCFSLVYFILYLCGMEIVPLMLIYRGTISICRISI